MQNQEELLLKKNSPNGRRSLSIDDLQKRLRIDSLMNKLSILEDKMTNVEKRSKEKEKGLLEALKSYLHKAEPLNILNSSSIEKNASIPVGTIYYNKTKDAFRGKTQQGWITLNLN